MPDRRQPSLFGAPPPVVKSGPWDRLPAGVRFGTSSWVYPGWKGTLYRRPYRSDKAFREECLEEYAEHPWFGCVGLDASFYRPTTRKTVARYVAQTPRSFRWLPKVWEQITIERFGRDRVPRGFRPGDPNPAYLDPEVFVREVLPSWEPEDARVRTGPLLFQFAAMQRPSPAALDAFCRRFDWFLSQLPKDFDYAVEIRTKELLQPYWFDLLHFHGVAHVYNHWDGMPPLGEQLEVAARAERPPPDHRVVRLLTPLSTNYAASVEAFAPYDRLKAVQPQCREETVRLVVDAAVQRMETYVIANNRLEGHSPSTVEAIGLRVIEALGV